MKASSPSFGRVAWSGTKSGVCRPHASVLYGRPMRPCSGICTEQWAGALGRLAPERQQLPHSAGFGPGMPLWTTSVMNPQRTSVGLEQPARGITAGGNAALMKRRLECIGSSGHPPDSLVRVTRCIAIQFLFERRAEFVVFVHRFMPLTRHTDAMSLKVAGQTLMEAFGTVARARFGRVADAGSLPGRPDSNTACNRLSVSSRVAARN